MGKKHPWFDCIWDFKYYSKGKLLWERSVKNALADEGEEAILETYFRDGTIYTPTEFYMRLCNDSLGETDSLSAVLNEPSGNGYAAQLIERSNLGFPTKVLHEGDYRLVSKDVTFTASGGQIGPVNTAYLATTSDNTGKLISYVPTSVVRTILTGDSMVASIKIKLS